MCTLCIFKVWFHCKMTRISTALPNCGQPFASLHFHLHNLVTNFCINYYWKTALNHFNNVFSISVFSVFSPCKCNLCSCAIWGAWACWLPLPVLCRQAVWNPGEVVAIAAFYNTDSVKMEYSPAARFHDSLTQFKVYEDYLDSKVTPMDLFYLKVSHCATNYWL